MAALRTLGDLIRYYRQLKGWSQTQLWKAVGLKQSRMSKLELDQSKPYFWEMERIAFFLEVPMNCFDLLRRRPDEQADGAAEG